MGTRTDSPGGEEPVHYERAIERVNQGDREGALDDLHEAIGRNPEHFDAIQLREQLITKEKI